MEFWSSGGDPFILSCVCWSFASKQRLFARNMANKALQTAKARRGQPYQPYLRYILSNLLAETSSRQGAKVVRDAIGRSRTKATFFDQARKGLDQNAWRRVQAGVFSCLVRLKWGMRVCKSSHKQDGKKGTALFWAGLRKPNRIGNVSHRWLGHSKRHLML